MTVDRVTDAFRHIAKGLTRRYPLRNLKAFNFVVENAFAGGMRTRSRGTFMAKATAK